MTTEPPTTGPPTTGSPGTGSQDTTSLSASPGATGPSTSGAPTGGRGVTGPPPGHDRVAALVGDRLAGGHRPDTAHDHRRALRGLVGARDAHRRRRRAAAACLGLAILVVAAVAMSVGAADVGPIDVLETLAGGGDETTGFVVRRLRLPRTTAAVTIGIALGLAGALFQSTLRNPLASPDILGISAGASVGAVTALLVLGLSGAAVSMAAGIGALAAAVAIQVLAWSHGLDDVRVVLVGIGIAYAGTSTTAYLLTLADVREAASALLWTVGDVGDVRDEQLLVAMVVVLLLTPAALAGARHQEALALGDVRAHALGVRPTRARVTSLGIGVGLVAAATSVAGPVPFVALVAPAIARRLLDDGGPALGTSGAVGALMVVLADAVALHALPGGTVVPVGVVTGLVGAPYLIHLLARTRTGSR